MDEEATEEQRKKNRRNKIIGGAIIGAGGLVLTTIALKETGALDGLNLFGNGSGHSEAAQSLSQGYFGDNSALEHGMPNAPEAIVPKLPEGAYPDVSNAAFDIPSGGSVTQMFDKLGIDTAKIAQNADALRTQFPDEFGGSGADVRINHPGLLSEQARTFIEGLR